MAKTLIRALGYTRQSSLTNAGADKDAEGRQREAISTGAGKLGYEVVEWYCDPGVSGADAIHHRPGFSAMLDRIEGNGVRIVFVEDPSRFARDLITQELGVISLQARGVKVFAANGQELTDDSDPMRTAMRQIAGAFAQLEKSRLVAKLRHGRESVRRSVGKCEGRKSIQELRPEAVACARAIAGFPKSKPSLRQIAKSLAERGHVSSRGTQFTAKTVAAMLT